ncbi:unnamed protein product [Jaminaea pallidilutea]
MGAQTKTPKNNAATTAPSQGPERPAAAAATAAPDPVAEGSTTTGKYSSSLEEQLIKNTVPVVTNDELVAIIAEGAAKVDRNLNILAKVEQFKKVVLPPLWAKMTFANVPRGIETFPMLSGMISLHCQDEMWDGPIEWSILSTPRIFGGLGMPRLESTLFARLLARILPKMCAVSPTPLGTVMADIVSRWMFSTWRLTPAVLLDKVEGMHLSISMETALASVQLRLLAGLLELRPSLTVRIDWDGLSPEHLACLPWFSVDYGWPKLYQDPNSEEPKFWEYPSSSKWAPNDWIASDLRKKSSPDALTLGSFLFRARLIHFGDLLWVDAFERQPKSSCPIQRLGLGPPTWEALHAYQEGMRGESDEVKAAAQILLRDLRTSWPARLSTWPMLVRYKLVDFHNDVPAAPAMTGISGGRPRPQGDWALQFPWHVLRFDGRAGPDVQCKELQRRIDGPPGVVLRPGAH